MRFPAAIVKEKISGALKPESSMAAMPVAIRNRSRERVVDGGLGVDIKNALDFSFYNHDGYIVATVYQLTFII